MIPNQRTGDHDHTARLVIADGHTHAGQNATIVQPCTGGYIVRIGDDPTRITPQYVPNHMLLIQTEATR